MTTGRTASFLRSGSILLAGSGVLAVGKAIILYLLANRFGPEVQGGFSLLLAVSTLGSIVVAVGLEYANAYIVGRDPSTRSGLLANSLAMVVLGLPVALVAAWFLALGFPQAVLGLSLGAGCAVLALVTNLTALQQMLQAIGIGAKRFGLVAGANALWGVSGAVTIFLVVGGGYPAVLIAWIVTLAAVTAFLLTRLTAPGDRLTRPETALLSRQIAYGLRTWPGSLARALNMRAPLYGCALFLSPEEVGVYGVAVAIADTFLYVPTALGRVTLGLTASREGRRADRRLSYLLIAVAGLLATLATYLFGRPVLVAVFGEPYGAATAPLTVLFIAVTLHAVGLVRLHYHLGSGEPHVASLAQGIALAFVVAGAWLLIPRLGLVGAAWTTLATYLAFTVYLFGRRPARAGASAPR